MPIKVIGAGLGRTGTLSLKMALEELGFVKCYHMTEVLANLEHVRAWDAAARGEPIDWEALFQGYQATVDWPGCTFYEELMRRYPEAKVVLSVRDPDRWYDSARKTIYYVRHAFPRWMPLFYRRMNDFHRMLDRLVWDGMFLGRFEDKAFATEVFNRYNDDTTNRSAATSHPTGCWSLRSGRAGSPSARSSASPSRRASRSLTSTMSKSSARGFSGPPGSCGRPATPSSPSWP
jgi:hypothetical protein